MEAVQDVAKKYALHADASYKLFEQFEDEQKKEKEKKKDEGKAPASILPEGFSVEGKDLKDMAEKGSSSNPTPKPMPGLSGYKGLADLFGFSGMESVLINPSKDGGKAAAVAPPVPEGTPAPLLPAVAVDAKHEPSWIGYIAKTTGADGVDELVFAFRGSVVGPDWATNLLGAAPTRNLYDKGTVHVGFYNMLHEVPEDDKALKSPVDVIDSVIDQYLDRHLADNSPLPRMVTVGHSLGGALATLAAVHIRRHVMQYMADKGKQAVLDPPADLSSYTQRQLQSYTYAAPRVGDSDFGTYMVQELAVQCLQLVNAKDPVPHLGPNSWKELKQQTMKSIIGMLKVPPPEPAAAAARAPDLSTADATAAAAAAAAVAAPSFVSLAAVTAAPGGSPGDGFYAHDHGLFADERLPILDALLDQCNSPEELEALVKQLEDEKAAALQDQEVAAAGGAPIAAAAAAAAVTGGAAVAGLPRIGLPIPVPSGLSAALAGLHKKVHYANALLAVVRQSWANNPGLVLLFDTNVYNRANHYLSTYEERIAEAKPVA